MGRRGDTCVPMWADESLARCAQLLFTNNIVDSMKQGTGSDTWGNWRTRHTAHPRLLSTRGAAHARSTARYRSNNVGRGRIACWYIRSAYRSHTLASRCSEGCPWGASRGGGAHPGGRCAACARHSGYPYLVARRSATCRAEVSNSQTPSVSLSSCGS
eukprot:4143390-Prymnesium_polylepis.2